MHKLLLLPPKPSSRLLFLVVVVAPLVHVLGALDVHVLGAPDLDQAFPSIMSDEAPNPYVAYCKPDLDACSATADACPAGCAASATACFGVMDNSKDGDNEWSTEFCSCCDDAPSLCCVLFCPCAVFGRTAEAQGFAEVSSYEGWCCGSVVLSAVGCGQCLVASLRTKTRHRYGIIGSKTVDCIVGCVFPWCALVQLEREIKAQDDSYVGPSGASSGAPGYQTME